MPSMSVAGGRVGLRWREAGLLVALALGVATTAATIAASQGPETAVFLVVMQAYGCLVYTAVGVLILWRRPGHGIGRLALATGLLFIASTMLQMVLALAGYYDPVQPYRPPLVTTALEVAVVMTDLLLAIGLLVSAILLVCWFPDGRPMSRLGRVVPLGLLGAVLCFTISGVVGEAMPILRWSPELEALINVSGALAFVALAASYLFANLDLVLRYRTATAVRRVQMRWLLAAVVVGVAGTIATVLFSDTIDGVWELWIMSTMLPVLAIGIAVTRYHLYDIDRIVSRTIAYAVVTAVLFGVFGLVNLGVQNALAPFIVAEGRAIGVALSTLAVANLFSPLRARVQRAVDRRFHRSRYDAERTVEGFAGQLRGNGDLGTLVDELRRTATEAVEPAGTMIWIRGGG
jgi:hypothetical protein